MRKHVKTWKMYAIINFGNPQIQDTFLEQKQNNSFSIISDNQSLYIFHLKVLPPAKDKQQ